MEYSFPHLAPQSKAAADIIYSKLKNNLLTSQIGKEDILTEVSVAEQYDSSRTPAREALHKLEQEGFLQSWPRKGYMLSVYPESFTYDLYNACIAAETMTAALAASRITDEDLDELQHYADIGATDASGMKSPEELFRHKKANFDFHTKIARVSGNQFLYDYVLSLQEKTIVHDVFRPNFESLSTLGSNAFTHTMIVVTLKLRDPEYAGFALRKHYTYALEIWQRSKK